MKTKNILYFLICLFAFSSCQDMFEPADENNRQAEDMAEESLYAHGLLIYAYDRLPYLTTTQTDIATDDAVTNLKNSNYLDMATGKWSADNNPMSQWDACKDGIQYVNLFLTIVDQTKWAPSAVSKQQMFVDRLKGEAYGLRALLYYYLLMAHGGYADDGVLYGVPLLTEPEDGSSDYNQPRATFAECVNQIFADCDNAIALLPADYTDISSVDEIPAKYKDLGATVSGYNLVMGAKAKNLLSGKVAETIKAQTALLAASPAFRDQSGVTSEQAAILCAKALERIGGLAGFDKDGNINWYMNATKLNNLADFDEILWREDYHSNSAQEKENFPPTLYGSGRVNPSQNFVDAFPMRNGYPITNKLKSGYNENDPYAGRDPRLANIVIYNGATFKRTVIYSGTYPRVSADGKLVEYNDNIGYDSQSTRTGYYLRKAMRDDVSPNSSSLIEKQHVYPRIRYTELFLAYAEAANDAWGPKNDPKGIGYTAYDVIKAIRERAGLGTDAMGLPLPEGDAYLDDCADNKAMMTDLIRNERRIELSFENKRFWDMRRWLLKLDDTVEGMKISKKDDSKDPTPDNLMYTRINVESRVYDNSYQCYGPLPKGEVLRWSNLKQNKGWK